ncbi:MAG: AAA family ATPase [Oscillospiraceae bacterium]|nr:AAA family ATPase [Oscillospiraceae bacterium]
MSKIIAVTSGKGGVGKSTVSVGLGQAISRSGKTAVIVELDSGLRGIDIMLGVENEVVYDFGDLLSGECSVEEVAVSVEACPGLSLIVASTSLSAALNFERMAEIFKMLKAQFDYVILDMPAGIALSLCLIPSVADMALLITTPDYISVRDSGKMVSALAEQGFLGCRLLINKVNTKYRRMNAIKDMDEVLDGVGVPLIGVLPDDTRLHTAYAAGELLEGDTAPAIVFGRIAKRIEGEYTPLYIQ